MHSLALLPFRRVSPSADLFITPIFSHRCHSQHVYFCPHPREREQKEAEPKHAEVYSLCLEASNVTFHVLKHSLSLICVTEAEKLQVKLVSTKIPGNNHNNHHKKVNYPSCFQDLACVLGRTHVLIKSVYLLT